MSYRFNYGAEPFQGFTEFDEFESLNAQDELGTELFGTPWAFDADFEIGEESESLSGRRSRAGARGFGRQFSRGPSRKERRHSAPRQRSSMRPRRPRSRPPSRPDKRPHFRHGFFPVHGYPIVHHSHGGSDVPVLGEPDLTLGSAGSWLRNGDRIIILPDGDDEAD